MPHGPAIVSRAFGPRVGHEMLSITNTTAARQPAWLDGSERKFWTLDLGLPAVQVLVATTRVCDRVHVVNGERVPLKRGDLVLMRPADVHTFRTSNSAGLTQVNLAFERGTVDFLHERYFAGGEWPWSRDRLPATYELEPGELGWSRELAGLLFAGPATRLVLERFLLALLLQLVSPRLQRGLPLWLNDALRRLGDDPAALASGVPALAALAGRSREHVNRVARRGAHRSATEPSRQFGWIARRPTCVSPMLRSRGSRSTAGWRTSATSIACSRPASGSHRAATASIIRRSFAARPPPEFRLCRSAWDGSDGTRTRDLRRDGPLRGSQRWVAIPALSPYACGFSAFEQRKPAFLHGPVFGRLLPVCCPKFSRLGSTFRGETEGPPSFLPSRGFE